MNKKNILASVTMLSLSLSCQQNFTKPYASPTPSPTVSSSDDFNVKEEEKYSNSIYCADIDDAKLKAELNAPIDLVVTQDGKKVYVINQRSSISAYRELRDINSAKSFLSPSGETNYEISRQFIYEIKDDKSISIVKVDDQYPFSCQLSEDIEIDKQDNIYISKTIIDTNNKLVGNPNTGHEIYKITPDKKMSKYATMTFKEPLRTSTDPTDPRGDIKGRVLKNMNITEDNKIVFALVYGSSEGRDSVVKLDDKNNLDYLISSYYRVGSGTDLKFRYSNGFLYSGLSKVQVPIVGEVGGQLPNNNRIYQTANPYQFGANTNIDANGNIYILDNKVNTIWKVIPDKEIIKFAGNGIAGYKDGKGEEAQFNNPVAVSFDEQGNLFVADMGNNAIRKITTDGTVSTFYKENK